MAPQIGTPVQIIDHEMKNGVVSVNYVRAGMVSAVHSAALVNATAIGGATNSSIAYVEVGGSQPVPSEGNRVQFAQEIALA